MRLLRFCLLLLAFLSTDVYAKGVYSNDAPLVKPAVMVPFGWPTRVGQGGVNLHDLMLNPGSPPVDHWTVQITTLPVGANTNWWETICGSTTTVFTSSTTAPSNTITESENCALTTPTIFAANEAQGYSAGVSASSSTVSGTTLTAASTTGIWWVGGFINGAGIPVNTVKVTGFGTGSGGNGTYTLNSSLTITPAQTITETPNTLCLRNGSQIHLTSTATDTNTGISGIPSGIATDSPYTVKVTGSGQVTDNAVFPSCVQSTSGSGARFTYTYTGAGTTPVPSSTGANNDLGWANATSPANGVAFTICAFSKASNSNCGVLTYYMLPDKWSLGNNYGAPSVTAILGDCTRSAGSCTGAGSTATIQAAVNACVNCTNTHGDLGVIISTGAVFVNPNTGPNQDNAVRFQLTLNNFTMIPAINAATWCTSSPCFVGCPVPETVGSLCTTSNLFTIDDACRHGSDAVATIDSSLNDCASIDKYTTFDRFTISSNGGIPGITTSVDHTVQGDGTFPGTVGVPPYTPNACINTVNASGIRVLGLHFGGTPAYNFTPLAPVALTVANACDVWIDNNYAFYATTFDSNWNVVTAASNITGTFLSLGSWSNHVYANYNEEWWDSNGWADGASTLNSMGLDIRVDHFICHGYYSNCQTQGASNIEQSDNRLFYSEQGPFSTFHTDDWQLNNTETPWCLTVNRWMKLLAGGNTVSQGFFNANVNLTTPANAVIFANSPKFHGVFFAGTANESWRFGGTDSNQSNATCGNTELEDVTTIRFPPNNPGSLGAFPYVAMLGFGPTQPSDGYYIQLGYGCAYPGCTQPGTFKIYFCATLGAGACSAIPSAQQVLIGTTINQTQQNLVAAMGLSLNGGDCRGVTMTPLDTAQAAASIGAGGSGAFFCWKQAVPTGPAGIPGNLLSSVNGSGAWSYSICTYNGTTCVSAGTGTWAVFQFGSTQNTYIDNQPLNTTGAGVVSVFGPGIWPTVAPSTAGTTCGGTSPFVRWCGITTFDKTVTCGSVQGTTTWYTSSAAQTGLGSTNFNWTNNNVVLGFEHANNPSATGCTSSNVWLNDTANGGIQAEFAAINQGQWFAWNDLTACQQATALGKPQPSGSLDINGNQTAAIGAETFDSTPLWNEGSGLTMCYDLNNTPTGYLH